MPRFAPNVTEASWFPVNLNDLGELLANIDRTAAATLTCAGNVETDIDIGIPTGHIANVGPHCSRPAYPRHIAQALQFARAPGGGLLAICLITTSLSFGHGDLTRAFDSRPVSCRVQPSVVSLPKEMRNVLRCLDLLHRLC
jgi:hypothetical protein